MVEVSELPNCKKCATELKSKRFDSRSGDFRVLVCDNPKCALYGCFQGSTGKAPSNIRITFV